ncbi:MAG: hypothetical protein ACRCUY_05745 [Thermoguttaceae bacterium]
MSVIPQLTKTDSPSMKKSSFAEGSLCVDALFPFPLSLQNAAFVSSGGHAYKLFSEVEEAALSKIPNPITLSAGLSGEKNAEKPNLAMFDALIMQNATKNRKRSNDSCSEDACFNAQTELPKRKMASFNSTASAAEVFFDLPKYQVMGNRNPASTEANRNLSYLQKSACESEALLAFPRTKPDTSWIDTDNESESSPRSLNEAIRRGRAVEGICGGKGSVKVPTLSETITSSKSTIAAPGISTSRKPISIFEVIPFQEWNLETQTPAIQTTATQTPAIQKEKVSELSHLSILPFSTASSPESVCNSAPVNADTLINCNDERFSSNRTIDATIEFNSATTIVTSGSEKGVQEDSLSDTEKVDTSFSQPSADSNVSQSRLLNETEIEVNSKINCEITNEVSIAPQTENHTKQIHINSEPLVSRQETFSGNSALSVSNSKNAKNHTLAPETNQTTNFVGASFHLPEHIVSMQETAKSQVNHLAELIESARKKGDKIISVCGIEQGDGCTTMSLCIANDLAERGLHVLLVDGHSQIPDLSQIMRVPVNQHVCEIVSLLKGRLDFFAWSDSPIEVTKEGTASPDIKSFFEIIATLRDDYDIIVIDSGALLALPLEQHISSWQEMTIDGVFLIHSMTKAARISPNSVAFHLSKHNIKLIGIAENAAK